MAENSFLDTGVVLGYCFEADMHHRLCREYVVSNPYEFYISTLVDHEIRKKEPDLATRFSDSVLEHVGVVTDSGFYGTIDSGELSELTSRLLSPEESMDAFLLDHYSENIEPPVTVRELKQSLRALARDIEQHANEQKRELFEQVRVWSRKQQHPAIERELSSLDDMDRGVCVDAHDLATHSDERTELATTNPSDFGAGAYRDEILDCTEIADIVYVSA